MSRTRTFQITLGAALAFFLASCTVGPEYAGPPDLGIAGPFAAATGDASLPTDDRWWRTLGDPRLDRLVDDALEDNLDLAIAGQRIRQARALRRQAAASLAPRVGTDLSFTRIDLGGLFDDGDGGLGPGLAIDSPIDLWITGFEAGWEIDIFGGNRRAVRGAKAREEAAAAAANGVRLAIAAEVADAYFALASLREQKTLLVDQIDSQKKQAEDLRRQREAGAASRLDHDRAIGRLETTRADIPPLDAGITAQSERLALLLGKRYRDLGPRRKDLDRAHLPGRLPFVRTGLPAGLLHRRPDIREIEREVAAAAEDVGVAVASFYPSFRIGGGSTGIANSFGDLFDASRFIWQLGPTIEWNPFTGGANRAALEAATASQKATLLGYEKTVLSAVAEVETQLANLQAETRRLAYLQRAEDALADAVEQVRKTHNAGAATFLDVLEEEGLREIQLATVQSKSQLMTAWILLHKSLGGGSPDR